MPLRLESAGEESNADRRDRAERGGRPDRRIRAWVSGDEPRLAGLQARGVIATATLSRLDIATRPVKGAADLWSTKIMTDPRFAAWNERADAYQIAQPLVFGGETIVSVGT